MKRGLYRIVALALLVLPHSVVAQEMTTVEQYMQQNNFEKNPGAAEHVFLRCASVMLLVGHYFRESAPDASTQSKWFIDAGNNFLVLAQRLPRFNEKFAADQTKRMMAAYRDRWQRAKALTGNFSDDPILRSDIKVCSDLAKAS